MRPPLLQMTVRTPELDQIRYPKLKHIALPFGGTMGPDVRRYPTGKPKLHAGWDLYANPGTSAFAITDGAIVDSKFINRYGNTTLLEFSYRGKTLYAFYAHLTSAAFHPSPGKPVPVTEGTRVALTGTTGNATGEAPHLHFELWTKRHVGQFPDGRISPGEVLGYFYDNMDNRLPYRDIG
jgi:murein DD-endopeptidase MepM/ murein hydrolase activator NlpD